MNEFEIIKKYFLPLSKNCSESSLLQDDVAKISLKKDQELILSKDVIIQDIHFRKSDGGFKIASKLLRANLSDLASSGAKPAFYLLGFCLPKNDDKKFITDFCLGLKDVADKYQISLIGGDSVATPDRLFFSITIFGIKNKKDANLKRSSAKVGDLIFVSGSIGDAFLGLQITQNKLKTNDYLLSRHFFPTPRIELGIKLAKERIANSAIDCSDGLLADLNHICQSSKLDAVIYQDQIPISKEAKKTNFKITDLISGGDDYELIFTASKNNAKKIKKLSKQLKLPLTCIGKLSKAKSLKPKVSLLNNEAQEVKINHYGYKHY